MQILHVCLRFTPRVLKMIVTQQAQSVGVMLMYKEDCQPDMFPAVYCATRYAAAAQFKQKLQFCGESSDVVWVHTSIGNPDMIDAVREYLPDAFIVWDVHDFVVDKMTPERIALADVIVCPGKRMAQQIKEKGGTHKGMPVQVIYNKCPRAFGCDGMDADVVQNSVVLGSGVGVPGGTVWRDYTGAQKLVHDIGMQLFVYSADINPELVQHYTFLLRRLPLWLLIERMACYEIGWAGAANAEHDIDVCVTNKFWEYLAAGIPVMTFKSAEMAEIAQAMHVGVEYKEGTHKGMPVPGSLLIPDRRNVAAAKKRGLVFLEDDAGYQNLMNMLVTSVVKNRK